MATSTALTVPEDHTEPLQLERSPLPIAERRRRNVHGLCLYCGEPGHALRSCLVHPSRPENSLKVISLVVLICYSASIYSGYVTVAICEMVFAAIFFFVFMMDWDKQLPFISWVWSDLLRAVVGAVLYLITSLICVISGSKDAALLAGGVFGLLATVLFAYDSYLAFLALKDRRQQSTATTVP